MDFNTSSQIVEDTIFYRVEIVLFLSDSFPPEHLLSEWNDSDTHTGTSEDSAPSASTAHTIPDTLTDDEQSVNSFDLPSILSEDLGHEAESDLTIPDDEFGDQDGDAGSVNSSFSGNNNPNVFVQGDSFLDGLVQVFSAIGLESGLLTQTIQPLQSQAPGTIAPPGTPVTGPVSHPVGAGIDNIWSIIAHSAQLAHLAPPTGAGTPVSGYYHGGMSVSSLGISDSESDRGQDGTDSPVDDDSSSGSDVGAPESPAGPPNSPILAGVPDGPDGSDTPPAPSPTRRFNLNAASAPFVPSGTSAGSSSAPGPSEPQSHPQGQEGSGASYAPDVDIYALGTDGNASAFPVLAPEYALGEAMAWEAACPLGIDEARKAQVAASPFFKNHGTGVSGGYGVGSYGGGQGHFVGGVSGYDGSGYWSELAAGGYAPLAERQPGDEPGFNGLGLDAQYFTASHVQPRFQFGSDGPGDGGYYPAGAYVQRLDGSYAAVEYAPEYLLEPVPARRYVVSGEGRMVYELRADGSSTAIGPAPTNYWGGTELPPELQPQPDPEAQPESEPEREPEIEGEAVPVRNEDMSVRFDVPTPPPGHHVAIVWGDGPNPQFRYLFLEDAPDEDDDGDGSRTGPTDGP